MDQSKLHKAGFRVLRTLPSPIAIYQLKDVQQIGKAREVTFECLSEHKSKAEMLRNLKELLKDRKTVVMNESDRDRNDKLVEAGFTLIRLDYSKYEATNEVVIKKWHSNQAWRTLERIEGLYMAEFRFKELLEDDKIMEG